MSISFDDVIRHVSRMVWDDDSNQSNDFEGEFTDPGGARHSHFTAVFRCLLDRTPSHVRRVFSRGSKA